MRFHFGVIVCAVIFLPVVLAFWDLSSFEKCNETQFQCPRGNCIDSNQVCDGHPDDCSDNFDEADCDNKQKCKSSDFFQCQNEKCIPISSKCNGIVECDIGEDERNCNNTTIPDICPEKYFRCGSGICIPPQWVCDGRKDCRDDSDEDIGCQNKVQCEDNEFMCANRKCISRFFYCDGVADCDDSSDELHCEQQSVDLTNCTLVNGKFACFDKSKCLDLRYICNGQDDCADKSDENHVLCSKPNVSSDCKNCSISCVSTKGDCLCPNGYKRLPNNTCQDLNECDLYGICDQLCNNTQGSFSCSCHPQFTLLADNRSCKIKGGEGFLLYSAEKGIKGIFLDSHVNFTVIDHLTHTTGITAAGKYIYWTVIQDGNQAIVKAHDDGSNVEMIVTAGLGTPENLAIDWMTFNIYFTDSKYQRIGVCTGNGYVCTVLHDAEIDKPRSIALSPKHGLLFWTDWGKKPMIGRSGMDGSMPEAFVSVDIHWPNGVTIDFHTERIYWLDAKSLIIETIKFDKTDRRHVLDNLSLQPFSIAVFENRLYWSDLAGNEIVSCNKFTGHGRKTVAREPFNRIYGLHIHHHLLQSPDIYNPCKHSQCSDMCLLSPTSIGLSYSCACPEGKKLLSSTCSDNRNARIVIAAFKSSLFLIEYVSLGRHKVEKIEMNLNNINALAYNSLDRSVLIFESHTRILYSYSLRKRQLTVMSAYGLGQIRALHYDEYGNNVYWCDWDMLTVEAMSLMTGNRTVITSRMHMETPIDIALVPEKGYMFVAFQASYRYTYIDRMSMSGSIASRQRFLDFEGKGISLRMHYSKQMKRLFWINYNSQSIESVNLEGKDRRVEASNQLFHTLTTVGNVLIWSVWRTAAIYSRNISLDDEKNTLQLNVKVDEFGLKLTAANLDEDIQSPCLTNNGNCSHLCLMSHTVSSKRVCACPMGLALSTDNLKCVKPKTCSKKEFECSTGECIPMERICDRHEDCIHGDDEDVVNCDGVRCPSGQFLCLDKKKCVDTVKKCDGRVDCADGSDELCHKNCTDGQYLCESGECIAKQFRCDGKVDCKHAYDEAHCTQIECDKDHFRCWSGQCIPQEWQCDQEPDCVDGSDEEQQCQELSKCLSFEYQCFNYNCVNLALLCNGYDDCGDNSDEMYCGKITESVLRPSGKYCNPTTEFYCPSSKHVCLPIGVKCNGVIDCATGDDEKDCYYDPCIKDKEFYCHSSRKCIAREWLCDGSNDCGDNADESKEVCMKKIINGSDCSGFKCDSGECISLSKVCNNISDCVDKSDEGVNCGMSCEQFQCNQRCLQTPKGPHCSCWNGYTLDKDGKSCIDVNECELNYCSQICNNTIGKYECSCYSPEYMLRSDHVTCKARGKTAILVAASETEVDIISSNLIHKEDFSLGTSLFRTVRGLDVDAHRNLVFILLENDELLTANVTNRNPSSWLFLPRCTSFAYDWIAENIFFIESHLSIKVRSIHANATNIALIHSTNNTRYMWALTVDPVAGFLFWFESHSDVQMAHNGSIKRADCNGANPQTLLSSLNYGVRKMVADSFGRHLYILNRRNRKIIRVNYDGTYMETVFNMDRDAVTFAFFENSVYWVVQDSDKYKIRKCKVYGLHPRKCETLKMNLNYIHHLTILQKNNQKFAQNLCASASCPGVCVMTQKGAECVRESSGTSSLSMIPYHIANNGFRSFFAYFVIICLILITSYIAYKKYSNPKLTVLQRFHFHNSTYNKPGSPTIIDKNADVYLSADEHAYENPLCQPKSSFGNELFIQKGGNSYLETLAEETVDCDLNSCSHRSSKESLIKKEFVHL